MQIENENQKEGPSNYVTVEKQGVPAAYASKSKALLLQAKHKNNGSLFALGARVLVPAKPTSWDRNGKSSSEPRPNSDPI